MLPRILIRAAIAAVAGYAVYRVAKAVTSSGAEGGSGPSLAPQAFLCDSCRFDDPRYCGREEFPNAIRCPDYAQRPAW